MLTTLLLAATLGCHISNALPIVTDWTIVGAQGRIVIDARLAPRADIDVSETYCSDRHVWWYHTLYVSPLGNRDIEDAIHCNEATAVTTVTDSTLHIEIPYAPGVYTYDAHIQGDEGGEPERCGPYSLTDTLTVLPDPSPAVRASWGSLKRKYAR